MKRPYDKTHIIGKELKSVKLNDRETLQGRLYAINEIFVTENNQVRSFFTALILGDDGLLYSLVGNFVFDKKIKYLRGLEQMPNKIIIARNGLTEPNKTTGKQYDNYFIRVIEPNVYTESKPQYSNGYPPPQQYSNGYPPPQQHSNGYPPPPPPSYDDDIPF